MSFEPPFTCGRELDLPKDKSCELQPRTQPLVYAVTFYQFCFDLCRCLRASGLAGLRVGFGAFPLSLVKYLWRAKQPYNVSVAAEVAACAALSNSAYLEVRFVREMVGSLPE